MMSTPTSQSDHETKPQFSWREEVDLFWAIGCDWTGNDNIATVGVPGERCGPECSRRPGCTHFTWTSYNGGRCTLKRNPTSLNKAIPRVYAVCGMMKSSAPLSEFSSGSTSRYWDCCKGSCGWNDKANVTAPVASCQRNGWDPTTDVNAASSCNDGPSYTCSSNQPWGVDLNLSYGFAAANLTGKSEGDLCCGCYELKFTSGPVSGKSLVVQITNTGGHLGVNQFALQIPGGGVGELNSCKSQWGAPNDGWGARQGGIGTRSECDLLPLELRPGCFWRFNWFKNADNPAVNFRRVVCPAELTQKSNCRRIDE